MSYEDYMKLPKESLARELERRDLATSIPPMPIRHSGWMCDGKICTNPQMDCINCPRRTTEGVIASPNTATGTSTLKAEGK